MSPTEAFMAVAIEMLCGTAGALGVQWRWPGLGLSRIAAILAGAAGGLALTFVAARIPRTGHLVGQVENAADSIVRGVGGLTLPRWSGSVSGLLGGVILAVIVGFIAKTVSIGK